MLLLIAFAFLAGVVTVLSPCILPLLPIILSSADGRGKQRPLGVVIGFVLSFSFFTLFLSTIVRLSGIPADSLRFFSIIVLAAFGISLLVPKVQALLEILFSKMAGLVPSGQKNVGFVGGIIVGLSLGLLWTPCVGPILASVISLAITGTVTLQAAAITVAYAMGTAIPMFIIMLAGSTALQKVPWLVRNTGTIQKGFGVLMILTAMAIYFNLDRAFQTYILQTFPSYGVGLTKFEEVDQVTDKLEELSGSQLDDDMVGKALSDVNQSKGVPAPELIAGGEWFNSEPLQLSELKGKVVLVDFWTYSCINCQRTLPYLRTWWDKYQQAGLVIIGVHSPEFAFEKNPDNVGQAIQDFELTYPVMQDNNFATWQAYRNRFWPAKYLIDKNGNVRYTHFGEGAYDETEAMIQELLQEVGADLSTVQINNPTYQVRSRTPELYLGSDRIQYLASPEQVVENQKTTYTTPNTLPVSSFAFQGEWMLSPEFAQPSQGSSLLLHFEAKQVFLVVRPKKDTASFSVSLDGETDSLGEDVENGVVTVEADTLYRLVDLPSPGKHLLELTFDESDLELFAFTFG